MTDIINQLDELAAHPDMKWVARWSTADRGFRLHQTRTPAVYSGFGFVEDTAREAVTAFLSNHGKAEAHT